MTCERIFVGRKAELEDFRKVLEDPQGQAVLVVGQAGMGKTWLIDKMAQLAQNHPELKCGWVRYEVTPTDDVNTTMALMIDDAFEAARTEPGSFDNVPLRKKQWLALFKVLTLIPGVGSYLEVLIELAKSLRRDPKKDTREQFIDRLQLISKRMPDDGRAIFIIDPEKYMQKESDESWAIVVKQVPGKIKFVFAQRPEDELVNGEAFIPLKNVVRIPNDELSVLEDADIEELLNLRANESQYRITELRPALSRYDKHPYAITGAFDLLKDGATIEELPTDPTPAAIARVQWRKVTQAARDAIRLFKAYAVLEVAVPYDIVEVVSEIDTDTRQHLLADKYLHGLLREEWPGKRIYHAILADYILEQISREEKREYHKRVVKVIKAELVAQAKIYSSPDLMVQAEEERHSFSSDFMVKMDLCKHAISSEDEEGFVRLLVDEYFSLLYGCHYFEDAIKLSKYALTVVEKGSEDEAIIRRNLRQVYRMKQIIKEAEAKADAAVMKALGIDPLSIM